MRASRARGVRLWAQILSGLTVIYVDIINHLPASVNAGSTNSSTARDISSSSPSGLERFLVIVLLVCLAAMEDGNEMYFSIVWHDFQQNELIH